MEAQDIVVTGAKVSREDLADLKLYRLAGPVTVASQAKKQVRLIAKPRVAAALIYEARVYQGEVEDITLILRARNTAAAGLGEPLPAGQAVVFTAAGARSVLLGQGATADKAVGEQVEIKLGAPPNVTTRIAPLAETLTTRSRRYRMIVTNANPWDVTYEARINPGDDGVRLERPSTRLTTKDGKPLWSVTVPANGTAALDYTIRDRG